ncbi:MAG: signal peptidase I [Lachnospiraceae bacterium]|nr:signal peptidase I [Lachnospiraceae bacterium]
MEQEVKKEIDVKKEILSWIKCIVFAIVLAFLVSHFLIVNSRIPSGSMENTIMTGDKLFALRTSYWFNDPKRGDIVVFKYPDDPDELFIKRVIGEPGDKVEVVNGKVFINDSKEPLEEPYIKEPMEGSYGPYYVPEGCYFMMGDNRNCSLDSRFWTDKYVKKKAILGKAAFRYLPLSAAGKIGAATYDNEIPEAGDYSEEKTTEAVTEFSANQELLTVDDLAVGINFTSSATTVTLTIDGDFNNSLDYIVSLYDAQTEDLLSEVNVGKNMKDDHYVLTFRGLKKGQNYYMDMYPNGSADTDEEYFEIEQENANCKVVLEQE